MTTLPYVSINFSFTPFDWYVDWYVERGCSTSATIYDGHFQFGPLRFGFVFYKREAVKNG